MAVDSKTSDEIIKALGASGKYDYSYFIKSGKPMEDLLINRALTGKLREYVINTIKAPLYQAIILAAWLIEKKVGKITRETTVRVETHAVLDIRDWFFEHYILESRKKLFEAAFVLWAFEMEHDSHYREIGNLVMEQVFLKVQEGKWPLKVESFTQENCWKE